MWHACVPVRRPHRFLYLSDWILADAGERLDDSLCQSRANPKGTRAHTMWTGTTLRLPLPERGSEFAALGYALRVAHGGP